LIERLGLSGTKEVLIAMVILLAAASFNSTLTGHATSLSPGGPVGG
jgi:hypothetical protein